MSFIYKEKKIYSNGLLIRINDYVIYNYINNDYFYVGKVTDIIKIDNYNLILIDNDGVFNEVNDYNIYGNLNIILADLHIEVNDTNINYYKYKIRNLISEIYKRNTYCSFLKEINK